MKDLLHPLCLSIAGTGFLFLLRDLGKSRRDPALVALAFTYGFSALSYATSLTWVWVRIDRTLGVTNISVPLAQSCVVLVLALQATVLAHWSKPLEEARRRGRYFLTAAGVVIAAMAVLFTLLTPVAPRPTDFSLYYAHDPYFQAYLTLYIATYTVAQVYLARSCWKYARAATSSSIAVGLRLVCVGAIITLGYSAIRIGAVLGAIFGFGVKGLEPYAWLCGDIGATLTQVGYFLPTLVSRTEDARAWVMAHIRYRRLHPLWAALDQADPGITLRRPAPQRGAILRGRSAHFPLLRRQVEIRQGQKMLRRHLDPAVRAESEKRRTAEGLSGPEFVAAVTADQIHHALIRYHAHDALDAPAEYADAALPLEADEELAHLQRVASYFTPPKPTAAPAERPGTASGVRP
ncbi:MAB_1171c family putative transporter [Streptomyces sp. NPDC001668]|uniref:MAB_1171c family putative transporter n=1 Tax=Streptomyces sp. NPDC001668 TaxID=3364598 RepID=UPI00369C3434